MNAQKLSRKDRWVLAGAVAGTLVPLAGQGAVGRVEFAAGNAVRVDARGNEQRLTRGTELNQGDTVRTVIGRAQIRFTDGAFTSVLPNSEFRIDEYGFDKDKEENSKSFFSLLKGGLRTITGAIGKLRKGAYRVKTPVATIGIRGTEYVAVLGNSLTVWVGDGIVEACNDGGCTNTGSGGQIYVRNGNTKGIIVDEKPDTNTGDGDRTAYSGPEETNADGTPAITTTEPETFTSGPFYALAIAVGESSEGAGIAQYPELSDDALTNVSFGAGAGMTSYAGVADESPTAGSIGSAQLTEVDSDGTGTLFWGRWVNGTIELNGASPFGSRSLDLSGSETLAFAGGLPTTDMPTSGSATLNLLGGTSPAYADGSGTGTLNSGSLVANFATSKVQVNMNIDIGGNGFIVNSGAGPVTIGSGGRPAFSFGGAGSFTTSAACSGGCSTTVEGFFAGAGASRAGLTYRVFDETRSENFIGAAGFAR